MPMRREVRGGGRLGAGLLRMSCSRAKERGMRNSIDTGAARKGQRLTCLRRRALPSAPKVLRADRLPELRPSAHPVAALVSWSRLAPGYRSSLQCRPRCSRSLLDFPRYAETVETILLPLAWHTLPAFFHP